MTTQENQTRSDTGERFERTESSHGFGTGAGDSSRYHGNRRTFLRGVGIVGLVSLSGCTVDENGIRWGDDDEATGAPADESTNTPVDEPTDTSDGETTMEDEEMDLSEYEDGCFTGGTPHVSNGVRDGVEITVTPAGVQDTIQVVRETIQFEYDDDLVLRDDIDLKHIGEEEDDDPMVVEAEVVEVDEEDDGDEENNTIVVEAELIEVDEGDEEDDDE